MAEAEVVGVVEVGTGVEAGEEGVALGTEIEEGLGTGGGTEMEIGEGIVVMAEIEKAREGLNQRGVQGADLQQTFPEGEKNQGGTAGIQEIRELTATPWIIRRSGGWTSRE